MEARHIIYPTNRQNLCDLKAIRGANRQRIDQMIAALEWDSWEIEQGAYTQSANRAVAVAAWHTPYRWPGVDRVAMVTRTDKRAAPVVYVGDRYTWYWRCLTGGWNDTAGEEALRLWANAQPPTMNIMRCWDEDRVPLETVATLLLRTAARNTTTKQGIGWTTAGRVWCDLDTMPVTHPQPTVWEAVKLFATTAGPYITPAAQMDCIWAFGWELWETLKNLRD